MVIFGDARPLTEKVVMIICGLMNRKIVPDNMTRCADDVWVANCYFVAKLPFVAT
jgi:hypothetical protein